MKERLEQWLDGIIEHSLALEAIGDYKDNKGKVIIGQMFSTDTAIRDKYDKPVLVSHSIHITDAVKAGKILNLPVIEIIRSDSEYSKEYYFKYKDWMIYSISK